MPKTSYTPTWTDEELALMPASEKLDKIKNIETEIKDHKRAIANVRASRMDRIKELQFQASHILESVQAVTPQPDVSQEE